LTTLHFPLDALSLALCNLNFTTLHFEMLLIQLDPLNLAFCNVATLDVAQGILKTGAGMGN
jgi:hypothetical protein